MNDINTFLSILDSIKRIPALVNDINFIPYMGEFADSLDGESELIEEAVTIIEKYLNDPSDTRSFAEYLFVLCSVIYKTFPSMHVHHKHENCLVNKQKAAELLIEAVELHIDSNDDYHLYPLLYAAQAAVVSGRWSKAVCLYQLLLDKIKTAEDKFFFSDFARNRVIVQILHNIAFLTFHSGFRKQARLLIEQNNEIIAVQEEAYKDRARTEKNVRYYLNCLTREDNEILFVSIPRSWGYHPEKNSYMNVGCTFHSSDIFFDSDTLVTQKVIMFSKRQYAIKMIDDPSVYAFACDIEHVSDDFDEEDPEGITFAQFTVSEEEHDKIGDLLFNRRDMLR